MGSALYIMLRGVRDRPLYEKVDGHYAPSWDNRGALPPCTGTGFMSSNDYAQGFGISRLFAHTAAAGILFQREGLYGNTNYLHAWLWTNSGTPSVRGYIYQRSASGVIINENLWFDETPTDVDSYIDPPSLDASFFSGDHPYCIRVEMAAGGVTDGLLGVNVWSEEFCQDPAIASFGLAAGSTTAIYRPRLSPSQQPSIVG